MLEITPGLQIDERKLEFQFLRASGPGGQHVNKTESAVQLRFDTAALPPQVRARLHKLRRQQITNEGILVIEAKRFRQQERNREDAIDRLVALLKKASETPKPRKPTRPSKAAKRRRMDSKTQRGRRKQLRKPPALD